MASRNFTAERMLTEREYEGRCGLRIPVQCPLFVWCSMPNSPRGPAIASYNGHACALAAGQYVVGTALPGARGAVCGWQHLIGPAFTGRNETHIHTSNFPRRLSFVGCRSTHLGLQPDMGALGQIARYYWLIPIDRPIRYGWYSGH